MSPVRCYPKFKNVRGDAIGSDECLTSSSINLEYIVEPIFNKTGGD